LITVGDIVIKVMHITSNIWGNTKFEEVIRLIFHTGFIETSQKMLSFKKIDLDLAYKDNRYLFLFLSSFLSLSLSLSLSQAIVLCPCNKSNGCFFPIRH
jgi:hypothetical protein